MNENTRRVAGRAGTVVSLAGALGISADMGCAVAHAGSGHGKGTPVKVGVQSPPAMKLAISPDEKVEPTGTQGDMRKSAVQGTAESPFQCDSTSHIATVSCDTRSVVAVPQIARK